MRLCEYSRRRVQSESSRGAKAGCTLQAPRHDQPQSQTKRKLKRSFREDSSGSQCQANTQERPESDLQTSVATAACSSASALSTTSSKTKAQPISTCTSKETNDSQIGRSLHADRRRRREATEANTKARNLRRRLNREAAAKKLGFTSYIACKRSQKGNSTAR